MKKRILFYYTHQESLGHTTRLLSIIQALKKRYPTQTEIAVFQGGMVQDYLDIPVEIKWINLPNPFYGRLDFKVTSKVDISKSKVRSDYMLSRIREFKPNIFITEFFPFGRRECYWELLPVLQYLKQKRVKIYASIGYPQVTKRNINMLLTVIKFYDRILIHIPTDTENKYFYKNTDIPDLYMQFFKRHEKIIDFTGYILPFNAQKTKKKESIQNMIIAKGKKSVLVTRGAGAYYPRIITNSILTKRHLGLQYYITINPGPASSEKETNLFEKCLSRNIDNNIYIQKYIPNLSDYLASFNIIVSTAGYNTVVQLFYFRKKSIVIPFCGYQSKKGYIEQVSRAEMLKDYLGSSILNYDELSPQRLAFEIEKKNREKEPKNNKINKSWFNGGVITSKIIMDVQ